MWLLGHDEPSQYHHALDTIRFKEETLPILASAEVFLRERMYNKLQDKYRKLHNSYKPVRKKQDSMRRVEEEEQEIDTGFVRELLSSKKARRRLKEALQHVHKGKAVHTTHFNSTFVIRWPLSHIPMHSMLGQL